MKTIITLVLAGCALFIGGCANDDEPAQTYQTTGSTTTTTGYSK